METEKVLGMKVMPILVTARVCLLELLSMSQIQWFLGSLTFLAVKNLQGRSAADIWTSLGELSLGFFSSTKPVALLGPPAGWLVMRPGFTELSVRIVFN